MTRDEFDGFFENYAKNIEDANKQKFWELSNALILELIKRHIPDPGEDGVILDAGGGTARWAVLLSRIYSAKFLVVDLSEHMLAVASENLKKIDTASRIVIHQGDLTNMKMLEDNSVDHIISIYSPLSFIQEKERMFSEMHRILKPNGKALVMGQGYFNAIASKINISIATSQELEKLKETRQVKWASHVPALSVFSKEDIESLFEKAGFTFEKSFGVPVFVQPGVEDFDPHNASQSRISNALEDKEFFEAVFKIEMEYNSDPSVVNRGMNIFSLARKTT